MNVVRMILFLVFLPAGYVSADGDVAAVLFRHILNGNELEILPFLPPLGLPFGMSVHLFMLLLAAVVVLAVFAFAVRKPALKSKGATIVLEALILFIRDDIVYPIMGEKRGRKWLPFFSTLFIFLLVVNFLGLVPAFKAATGNLSVTTALAVMVLVLTLIVGMRNLGIPGFFRNLYPEGTAAPVGVFVAFLEFFGIFIKSLVLSLRLFANMFAGHLAILSFLVLMFLLSPLFGFISIPFSLFTYVLEVLVSLIQALVFTLLSCIFITMAGTVHEE